MANIVNSLFGVDLDALQKQQESQAPIDWNMDPRAVAGQIASNQGSQIGRGLGKLFGGEDEVVAKQRKVNEMLQGVQASLTPEELNDPIAISGILFCKAP